MTRLELFFGRNVMDREAVSDQDWKRFLDEEITPRFPDGFTVLDTYGQWRNANTIAMERGKELIVIAPGSTSDVARANAIRDAYKRLFMQESVLFTATPACASF